MLLYLDAEMTYLYFINSKLDLNIFKYDQRKMDKYVKDKLNYTQVTNHGCMWKGVGQQLIQW
jgi:hypothetical protein